MGSGRRQAAGSRQHAAWFVWLRRVSGIPFMPQGGGDHYQQHRCPGAWITIELMKVAVRLLTNPMVYNMVYNVPEQDLRISLRRVPTIPESHFIISNVSRARANALGMTIGLM